MTEKMVKVEGYVPKKFWKWFRKHYKETKGEDKKMLRLVDIHEVEK